MIGRMLAVPFPVWCVGVLAIVGTVVCLVASRGLDEIERGEASSRERGGERDLAGSSLVASEPVRVSAPAPVAGRPVLSAGSTVTAPTPPVEPHDSGDREPGPAHGRARTSELRTT